MASRLFLPSSDAASSACREYRWRQIRIRRLFLVHRMIRLMSRRGNTPRLIGAILIGHFMGIDLPRWLPVLDRLRCAIGFVGGSEFVVVQTSHAAFGLWLGP